MSVAAAFGESDAFLGREQIGPKLTSADRLPGGALQPEGQRCARSPVPTGNLIQVSHRGIAHPSQA